MSSTSNWVWFSGILSYRTNSVIVQLDNTLIDYHMVMIPKYFTERQKQMHHAHITAIRSFETPDPIKKLDYWGFMEGCKIYFQYNHCLMYDEPYYYLDVKCEVIGYVRRLFGLPEFRDGYDTYHITICNTKGL
jgi:hypothetical protein